MQARNPPPPPHTPGTLPEQEPSQTAAGGPQTSEGGNVPKPLRAKAVSSRDTSLEPFLSNVAQPLHSKETLQELKLVFEFTTQIPATDTFGELCWSSEMAQWVEVSL